FHHQTIASLAAAAGTGPDSDAGEGQVAGAVPPTPIQRWFFEQELEETHHFNQARLLQLKPGIPPEHVERAVAALAVHHDALRLRFTRTPEGWHQHNAPAEENPVFSIVRLAELSGASDRSDPTDPTDQSDTRDWRAAL